MTASNHLNVPATIPSSSHIVFIDAAVDAIDELIQQLKPGHHVVYLDANQDGVEQITQAIAHHPVPATIHIVSHGTPGCLYLGNAELSLSTLDRYASHLSQWQGLDSDHAMMLYGCQVAAGDAGEEFITKLQRYTGREIAASSTKTGAVHLGGDWVFQYQTAPLAVTSAFEAAIAQTYPAVLMPFTEFDPGTDDPITLVNTIVVPGSPITIDATSVNFTGAAGQTSFYDGSLTELEIGAGILLTSGDGTPPLTNTEGNYSTSQLGTGDPDLDEVAKSAFASAGETRDANILEFKFFVNDPEVLSITFDILFGSDEFPEFSDTTFVDVAGVFVNGVNVGLFNQNVNQPLSVISDNLSVGNFINNGTDISALNFGGTTQTLPIEYDGLSSTLAIGAPVVQGENTIKIAVADTGDQIYDSGLFISNLTTASFESISGVLIKLNGTDGDDILTGTDKAELIDSGSGNDQVNGILGNDFINGGIGNDLIFAGGGNDEVNGGPGDDTINGEDGNDILRGQGGDDIISGNGGKDRILGGGGNDILRGDDGDDVINGRDGNDRGFGGNGNDFFFGELGNDMFRGGNGRDRAEGGEGNDTLIGNNDNDRLVGNSGNDKLNGGNGNDNQKGGAGKDTLIGGNGNDKLNGGEGRDTLNGGKGKNTFTGGKGKDTFIVKLDQFRDVIRDFRNGQDRIDLPQGIGFSDLTIEQRGNNVLISRGDDEFLLLRGIRAGKINAADFI